MADFDPGRNIVRASTIAGGSASDTHQFSGSVVLHNVDLGTAAADSNLQLDANGTIIRTAAGGGASLTVKEVDGAPTVAGVSTIIVSNGTLTDDGGGEVTLTTGGGGGGAPSNPVNSVQFNDAGAFGGDAQFSWTGTTLNVTGTTFLSGTVSGQPTLNISGSGPYGAGSATVVIDEDKDASLIVGEAHMGNGGSPGLAYFGHKDKIGASAAAVIQFSTGQTHLNAPQGSHCKLSVNAGTVVWCNGTQPDPMYQSLSLGAASTTAQWVGGNMLATYPVDITVPTRIGSAPANAHLVTGSLSVSGGLGIQLSKSSDATINLDSTTDYFVVCTRDGAVTVNLPAAADAIPGSMFIIKDGLGTNRGSGGKAIIVSSSGDPSDVIDGTGAVGGYDSQLTMAQGFGADQFISDGVNTWYSY